MRFVIGGLLVLALATVSHAAGLRSVQQAYAQGIQFERSRNYQAGLEAFKTALTDDPSYYWAEREAGNCAYYLGRNGDALGYYERYLDANPSDKRFEAFVGGLRARIGKPQEVRTRPWAWCLGLDGGAAYVGASDIKQFVSGDAPFAVSGPDSLIAPLGGLELSAVYHGFLQVYGRIDLGPFKSASVTQQGESSTGSLSLSEWAGLLGARYCWQVGRHNFRAGLAFGDSLLTGTYSASSSGGQVGSLTLSGMTWVLEPSAGYEFRISKRWGLEGTLGYRMAKFSTINGGAGSGSFDGAFSNPLKFADGNAVTFDDSGVFGRIGLVMHFLE